MSVSGKLFFIILLWGTNIFQGCAAAFKCETPNTGNCSSCGVAVICMDQGQIDIACPSGQVCAVENNIGQCFSIADDKEPACKCGTDLPSSMVDAYDDTQYIMCLPDGTQAYAKCPAGQIFDTNTTECAVGPTTISPSDLECKKPGFATAPGCVTYWACSAELIPSTPFECDAGKMFDLSKDTCVEESSLVPETFTCTGTKFGGKPDNVECNAFHVCAGTTEIGGIQCCEANERFNAVSNQCVPASEVPDDKCPQVNSCIDKSYLNSTCGGDIAQSNTTGSESNSTASGPESNSTATSSMNSTTPSGGVCTDGTFAPFPGDCKKFYSCANGQQIEGSCPGKLLFNPTLNLCDLAENAGCNVKKLKMEHLDNMI